MAENGITDNLITQGQKKKKKEAAPKVILT